MTLRYTSSKYQQNTKEQQNNKRQKYITQFKKKNYGNFQFVVGLNYCEENFKFLTHSPTKQNQPFTNGELSNATTNNLLFVFTVTAHRSFTSKFDAIRIGHNNNSNNTARKAIF